MIVQLNGIDRIKRMLFLHLLIPSPALQELSTLIVYPEGVHEELVDLADPLFCRLLVEHAACLERRLLMDQRDQLRLTCHRLRKDRISSSDTIRLVGITPACRDLPVLLCQLERSTDSQLLNASTKSNRFTISGDW